jgi:hypothetical protein
MLRALSTLVAATGLGLIFYEPSSFPALLQRYFGDHCALARPTAAIILGLWLTTHVNALLSSWAERRWLWKQDETPWHWQDELAVVTGGSNGIGAAVVQKLVARGIKVAVLDLEPLPLELRKGSPQSGHVRPHAEPCREASRLLSVRCWFPSSSP